MKIHFSCFIDDSPFVTRAKKKGVSQLYYYASVSPNTYTNTTEKPTPKGVSIRFPLLIGTLKLAISDIPQVEANTSFILTSLVMLYHINLILSLSKFIFNIPHIEHRLIDYKYNHFFSDLISFTQKNIYPIQYLTFF